MQINIKRRNFVRAVTFSIALVLVLSGIALVGTNSAENYRVVLENGYQRSLLDLTENMSNISAALDKGVYASSATQMTALSTELWREAGAAKTALSSLPLDDPHLDNTYRFLSQVGDYAMAISRKVSSGGTISEEESKNLLALAQYAQDLTGRLNEIERDIAHGMIYFGETASKIRDEDLSEDEDIQVTDGFAGMEEAFTDYPTLIYDGPFSDHILNHTPTMTKNARAVTQEAAQDTAAKVTGIAAANLSAGSEENSTMPAYTFYNDDSSAFISVTKQGGFPLCFINNRAIGDRAIDSSEAVKIAEKFLSRIGLSSMAQSYYEISGGICVVNFAYLQNGIICYSDLVKICVAMDNGEVVGFDTRGYLNNHVSREIPDPVVSQDDARSGLNANLNVIDSKLAVIPTSGQNEVPAYEFLCRGIRDQKVMVYVNTQTGDEEKILLLIENELGVLTR